MKFIPCARRARRGALLAMLALLMAPLAALRADAGAARGGNARARIFILMVWDGLRPDLVSAKWTPNLFAMANAGVLFAHHHAIYPSITMVNAASLATGEPPGTTSILGDQVSMSSRLRADRITPAPAQEWATRPLNLEDSAALAALNGPGLFNGALLGSESLGERVRRAGGYLAIVGKKGPTFMFDDSVTGDSAPGGPIAAGDFIFAADDLVAPDALKAELGPVPPRSPGERVLDEMRDRYFTRVVIERALARAKTAAREGHPALIVLWQHNPDLTQHRRGLGTQADFDALRMCDANLADIRHAVARLGITENTDLMVVSDHGFATVRAMVPLAQLLVDSGLKQSPTSDDVSVIANGGTDLIELSRGAFSTIEAQRAMLQKIVDFIEARPWAGPLFTRTAVEERALARAAAGPHAAPGRSAGWAPDSGPGWVAGTFSMDRLGLIERKNLLYAPDLIVSFRELPDIDNAGLTGPDKPAYVFGQGGESSAATPNKSDRLIVPIPGLMYADSGGWGGFTTGLGMHAAAGARELHNFCAAVGPDFRRHFIDRYPSGNLDVAPTIARVMHLPAVQATAGAGRVLDEAIAGDRFTGRAEQARVSASRTLSATEATTTLNFSVLQAGGRRWEYLDGAEYRQTPLVK
jgi:hypothetical protein